MSDEYTPMAERPFGMVRLVWHVWRYGHAVRTNRGITTPPGYSGRGWLYVCECGGVVAK